jgi:hypothetical protein
MDIIKRFNYKTNKKEWSVYFGAGTSKTLGFFEKKIQAKLFVDWLIKSDYSRIDNEYSRKAYWKYQDSIR